MSNCGCDDVKANNRAQRTVLRWLLLINGMMFAVENISGLLSHSTALVADSLDMLADAIVYGISLAVVGHSEAKKARVAFLSGYFQMTLAGVVVFDVVRRFATGSEPEAGWMIAVGAIALAANLTCFALIDKQKGGGLHMRASWIFSRNDAIANLSVIVAGLLVIGLNSQIPDLIIGLGISILVLRGGMTIIREAQQAA